MSEEIKFQKVDPFGHLTLSDAELVALFMAGKWVPMPVRYMTREELAREYTEEK